MQELRAFMPLCLGMVVSWFSDMPSWNMISTLPPQLTWHRTHLKNSKKWQIVFLLWFLSGGGVIVKTITSNYITPTWIWIIENGLSLYTSRRTGNRSYFSDQVASSVNVSRPYLWWPWDLCTTRVRFAIAIGGSRSWESYLLSQTFAHTGNLAPNLWCSAKWNLQCQCEFAALASNHVTDFWKIHLGRDLQKHVANQTVCKLKEC